MTGENFHFVVEPFGDGVVAIHWRRAYNLAYADFYRRLIQFADIRNESVLASVLQPLREMYARALCDDTVPYVHMVASNEKMAGRVREYGNRKGWTPDQWAWLCISAEHDRFYDQLAEFVRLLNLPCGDEISELLKFQRDIILRLNYDPQRGNILLIISILPATSRLIAT